MTDTVERRLDAVFTGPLAHARSSLSLCDGEPDGLPARDLFAPDRLEACLDAFGREHRDADPRAVVSYWSLWYFGGLLVPSVAATVGLRRTLPATVDQVRVTLAPETGRVTSFLIPLASISSDHDRSRDSTWFDPLIVRHVAPVVDILSARYRVGRGLLWGNAAHYVEWALAELEARPDAVAKDARRARGELLDRREWPGLGRNPLHGAIRYVSDGAAEVRRRRVCCLRHLLPGVAGCGSLCPLAHVREES